jgi:hypothetical protein
MSELTISADVKSIMEFLPIFTLGGYILLNGIIKDIPEIKKDDIISCIQNESAKTRKNLLVHSGMIIIVLSLILLYLT